jgi:6-phosphogluconolactonase
MEPHVPRLTLTYPVINAARNVFVIVTGANKAARVAEALRDSAGFHATPVSGVQPTSGRLVWMLDEAAASSL